MRLLIHDYYKELRSLAEEAVEIRILIAFMTETGLGWLPKDRIPLSECIVGTGLGITTPDAIRKLMDAGGAVWVFQDPSRLFHPKALYFRTADREYLIVGSNNLTSAGISSNYELSTLATRHWRQPKMLKVDSTRDFLPLRRPIWMCRGSGS
jgi:HKD family nuclease